MKASPSLNLRLWASNLEINDTIDLTLHCFLPPQRGAMELGRVPVPLQPPVYSKFVNVQLRPCFDKSALAPEKASCDQFDLAINRIDRGVPAVVCVKIRSIVVHMQLRGLLPKFPSVILGFIEKIDSSTFLC